MVNSKKKHLTNDQRQELWRMWRMGKSHQALIPQFIDPSQPFLIPLLILLVTYFVVGGAFLLGYGFSASWIASKLKDGATVLVHRVGGVFLIGAAAVLGLKTLRESA